MTWRYDEESDWEVPDVWELRREIEQADEEGRNYRCPECGATETVDGIPFESRARIQGHFMGAHTFESTAEVTEVPLKPAVRDWILDNFGSIGAALNAIVTGVMEAELKGEEDIESTTLQVRRRFLKMHRNVLKKELGELERQLELIEDYLERSKDEPGVLWELNVATLEEEDHLEFDLKVPDKDQ